jgi:hypothetical protein
MRRRTLVLALAAVLGILAAPSMAHAWGCYHAGYTHVGYGGVHHVGATSVNAGGSHAGGYHAGGYHYGGTTVHAGYTRRW